METIIRILYKDGDAITVQPNDLFKMIMSNDCQEEIEIYEVIDTEYQRIGKLIKRLKFETL